MANGTEHAPSLTQATLLRIGLDVLAERAIRVGIIASAAALSGCVIFRPNWMALLALGVYGFLVFPVVWRKEET